MLEPLEVAELVERVLRASADGRAHGPLRTVVKPAFGWFATMPAVVDMGEFHAVGAKLVSAAPGNVTRGLPTHQAVIALLDRSTGAVDSIVAGEHITEMRTAAMSAVAAKALGRSNGRVHAILGAGAEGRAHLAMYASLSMVRDVRVWSRDRLRAQALARDAQVRGLAVQLCGTADEAARGADVVTTATAAATPILSAGVIAPGTHVNAVGSCVPEHRELPGELMAKGSIYVDSRAGGLAEAGDILLAVKDGLLTTDAIRGELGEVLAGKVPGRTGNDEITIFESLGMGILDVACAQYAVNKVVAKERNL